MHFEEEKPALLTAVLHGDLKTVTRLLDNGTDVNKIYEDHHDITAVYSACANVNMDMVLLLLAHGADLEATTRFGETCCTNMTRMKLPGLKLIIRLGARVNRRTEYGNTALHYCANLENHGGLEVLLKNGAIMRKNENNDSPIIFAALYADTKAVQLLCEHTFNHDMTTFSCNSNQSRFIRSSTFNILEAADAYKLLGANCSYTTSIEDTRKAWSTALNLHEKAKPKPCENPATSCNCSIKVNSEVADNCRDSTNLVGMWSAVSLPAQKKVTEMELIERARKPAGPTWMSNLLPCFNCSACLPRRCVPSIARQFRLSCVSDKIYLSKWKQLHAELQSLYKDQDVLPRHHDQTGTTTLSQTLSCSKVERINHTGSNVYRSANGSVHRGFTLRTITSNETLIKPISICDAILGIEPTCFTQDRSNHNDLDPRSYYLQRHWLIRKCYTHPRTTFRSSYRACTVCGHMIIQFSGVSHLQSPHFTLPMLNSTSDLVCIGCSLVLTRIASFADNHNSKDSKQAMTNGGFRGNRPSMSDTHAAVAGEMNDKVKHQIPAIKLCPHCGLVSEQHPLLQSLKQSTEKAFGEVREFASREDITEITSNPSALCLQKFLINTRIRIWDHPCEILRMVIDRTTTTDIPEFKTMWDHAYIILKVFFRLDYSVNLNVIGRFSGSISSTLAVENSVHFDPHLIVNFLELAVDCVQEMIESEKPSGYIPLVSFLLADILTITSVVLLYYLPEVPFHQPTLRGHYLIALVTKDYCEGRNSEEHPCPPALIHRFISQVYRLICLAPELQNAESLIHLACSTLANGYVNNYCVTLTVQLLLRLGVNPNCIDVEGQTVVGEVLKSSIKIKQKSRYSILQALMEGGTHMDVFRSSNAWERLDENLFKFFKQHNICPVHYQTLACLTAVAMRQYGLTASNLTVKTFIPYHLLQFIDLH